MPLKIVKSTDLLTVEQLVVCLYSPPGLGKSTIGFSSASPLLLDFDHGAHRAAGRKDAVLVNAWSEVTDISDEDLAPYETVVVDTAGRALDLLSADIIRRDAKMGRGGALTLQGYGRLKAEFTGWLKHLRTMGKDIVLLAHSSEDKNGDELIERIDMQGASKGEVYKVADAMGRLTMVAGRQWPVLTFSPSDAAFGKNPGQMEPIQVPDISAHPTFLADIIQQIKDKLNALTDAQREAQDWMNGWREKLSAADSAEAYTALVSEAQEAPEQHRTNAKRLLTQAAKKAGYAYDKDQGAFVEPEPEAANAG